MNVMALVLVKNGRQKYMQSYQYFHNIVNVNQNEQAIDLTSEDTISGYNMRGSKMGKNVHMNNLCVG
jgi:uncharacterized protein YktA (UPF0223 family)